MFESIRATSSEEFAHQLQEYSGITQAMLGFTLLPPSFENDEGRLQVANLDNPTLRRLYKSRMEIFDAMHHSQMGELALDDKDMRRMQNTLQILNNLDSYIEQHNQIDEEEQTLRGRQFNAFEDLRNFIEAGETDGYIKLPTGVGKTVLFTEAVEATDVRTLILVPTIDLVHQTEEKFQLFASQVEVGKIYGREKDSSKKVTVITYESLLNQIRNGNIKPEDYGLVILDEDHKSYSPMRSIEIEKFKDSIKLGFTATPDPRTTRKEIHSMTIKEAVEEGLLADFRVWIAQTDIDLSNVEMDHGKYDEKQLEKALNVAKRNKAAIDLYKDRFEGQSTLAFCVSIQHAKDLAKQMRAQGIKAIAVHGGMNGEERKKILQQFRDGVIDVVCNVDVLIEGFDSPNASVCLNLRPTFSPVVAEQRGGRVLRLDKNDPKKEAVIVDFIDQDSREKPISFADIVGSSFVEKKKGGASRGGTSGPVVDIPKISIDGLTVITDVEEVMTVINENRKIKIEQTIPVQDTEFLFNSTGFRTYFVGEYSTLLPIAQEVVNNMLQEGIATMRKGVNGTLAVDILSNKDIFIQRMKEKGVMLKEDQKDKSIIGDNELVLSRDSLIKIFYGASKTIQNLSQEVANELLQENPDLIIEGLKGGQKIKKVIDRNLFIQKMVEKGAKLRETIVPELGEGDFSLSQVNLLPFFVGKDDKIRNAAKKVVEEIRAINPELIVKRRVPSGHMVDAVTDKKLFISKMIAIGVKPDASVLPQLTELQLNDSVSPQISENEMTLVLRELRENFIGSQERLSIISREIIEEIKATHPELIVMRQLANGKYAEVITDKGLFIKLMAEKGVKKR